MLKESASDAIQKTNRQSDKRWLIFFAVVMTTFINCMDMSSINVALPSIADELHVTMAGVEWVVTSYTLVIICFILLFVKRNKIFFHFCSFRNQSCSQKSRMGDVFLMTQLLAELLIIRLYPEEDTVAYSGSITRVVIHRIIGRILIASVIEHIFRFELSLLV